MNKTISKEIMGGYCAGRNWSRIGIVSIPFYGKYFILIKKKNFKIRLTKKI